MKILLTALCSLFCFVSTAQDFMPILYGAVKSGIRVTPFILPAIAGAGIGISYNEGLRLRHVLLYSLPRAAEVIVTDPKVAAFWSFMGLSNVMVQSLCDGNISNNLTTLLARFFMPAGVACGSALGSCITLRALSKLGALFS